MPPASSIILTGNYSYSCSEGKGCSLSSTEPEETNATNFVTPDESTGNAELDQRLAEPVFRGDKGIDAAQVWFSAILALVLGLLAFSNIIAIPLHGADADVLTNTDSVGMLPGFTLWLNSFLGAYSTGFRAVNLLLHLINGLLLFLLYRKVLGAAKPLLAVAGAMLFVVHPLVTETVVSLSGRSFILCTTFILASLLAYARTWQGAPGEDGSVTQRFAPWPFGLSLFFFALAWACNATAALVPALIFALDIVLNGKKGIAARIAAMAAYWLALAGLIGVASASGGATGLFSVDAMPMGRLLGLLFWPKWLSVVHASGSTAVDYAVVAAVFVGGAIFLACRCAAGLSLFWIALALVLNIAGAGERAGYILIAGAALLLPGAFIMQRRSELKAAAGVAMAGVIIAAGVATYMRDLEWQDEMLLWLDAAGIAETPRRNRKNPRCPRADERRLGNRRAGGAISRVGIGRHACAGRAHSLPICRGRRHADARRRGYRPVPPGARHRPQPLAQPHKCSRSACRKIRKVRRMGRPPRLHRVLSQGRQHQAADGNVTGKLRAGSDEVGRVRPGRCPVATSAAGVRRAGQAQSGNASTHQEYRATEEQRRL
jgi:hypothetical protein